LICVLDVCRLLTLPAATQWVFQSVSTKMLYDVMIGAVSQGVNKPTLLFLNLCMLCLWCTLAALFYISASSNDDSVSWLAPHAAILLGICSVLALLINWFVLSTGVTSSEEQEKTMMGADGNKDEPVAQIGEDLPPDLRERLENLPLQSNLDFSIAGATEFDTANLAIQPMSGTPLGMDPLRDPLKDKLI
jgi:hypothetical protein